MSKCLFLVIAFLIGIQNLLAQAPQICDIKSAKDFIYDYNLWDWEIPVNHNNYCKTWAAKTLFNAQAKGILDMAAPWHYPSSEIIYKITIHQDFTKDTGWVLLNKCFGNESNGTYYPSFALYNTHRNLIRLFIYYTYSKPSFSNLLVALRYENDKVEGCNMSLNSLLVEAPAKYYNTKITEVEKIKVKIIKDVIEFGWTFTEFEHTILVKENTSDFTNSGIFFELYGSNKTALSEEPKEPTNNVAIVGMLYPNPSNDVVNVAVPPTEQLLKVKLLNTQGVLLADMGKVVDFSTMAYPAGLYVVEVITSEGSKRHTLNIVK